MANSYPSEQLIKKTTKESLPQCIYNKCDECFIKLNTTVDLNSRKLQTNAYLFIRCYQPVANKNVEQNSHACVQRPPKFVAVVVRWLLFRGSFRL